VQVVARAIAHPVQADDYQDLRQVRFPRCVPCAMFISKPQARLAPSASVDLGWRVIPVAGSPHAIADS